MDRIGKIAEKIVAVFEDGSEKEMCWSIKEHLPVEVSVRRVGGVYHLEVPPMTMSYRTFEHLHQNHRLDDIDVHGWFYDYEDGKAGFRAGSREDVIKWFEFYKNYVRPANSF